MVPGFDDAKTTEMRARLDDRLGLWAVTTSCSPSSSDQDWRCSWSWSSPSGSAGDGCARKRRSVERLGQEFD